MTYKLNAPFFLGDNSKPTSALGLACVCGLITIIFFFFIFNGCTIATSAENMASYFPWRGVLPTTWHAQLGYPQTDFGDSFFPHWKFLADQLRSGHLPLWYPFDFGGTRSPETGLFGFYYFPRLALLALLGPIEGHTAMMMIHVFLALFFSYRLIEWLGCSRGASLTGALVWALNGHNIYYMPFEFVLIIAAWLPLSLWAAGRAIEQGSVSWAILSGTATGTSWFCGYANYSYAFGLITLVWWIYLIYLSFRSNQWVMNSKPSLIEALRLPIVSLIAALLVGAAFWLPFIDVFRTAVRVPASLADQMREAITPIALIRGMVWPASLQGPVWGYDSPSLVFVGPAALLLAFGVFRRNSASIFLLIIGAIAFAFVTGFRPLFRLGHMLLPMFGAIHPSTVGSQVFVLAVAVLSAFGLDVLINLVSGPRRQKLIASCLAIFFPLSTMVALFALMVNSLPIQPAASAWNYPPTPLTRTLVSLQKKMGTRFVPVQPPGTVWHPPIFFAGSHGSVGLKSVFGYDSIVQPENMWIARAVSAAGHLPSQLAGLDKATLGDLKSDNVSPELLGRLSIGLIAATPQTVLLSPDGVNLVQDGQFSIAYSGKDGMIFEAAHPRSRVFLAKKIKIGKWGESALRSFVADRGGSGDVIVYPVSAGETALVKSLSGSAEAADGTVSFLRDMANEVTLRVQSPRRNLLVLHDTWAPGWKATVNGVAVPVLRADYAYRAVVVPAGISEVDFEYRPLPLLVGLGTTVVAYLAILGFCFRRKIAALAAT